MTRNDWRPKLVEIQDPIADDRWEYITPKGEKRVSRLTVGRPTPFPQARCWYCPVMIEGHRPKIRPVFGEGPVDALMNAMNLVRRFYEENFAVVVGVKVKKDSKSKPKQPRSSSRRPATTPRRRQWPSS